MTIEERVNILENQVDDMSAALNDAFKLIETQAEHINSLYGTVTDLSNSLANALNAIADIREG